MVKETSTTIKQAHTYTQSRFKLIQLLANWGSYFFLGGTTLGEQKQINNTTRICFAYLGHLTGQLLPHGTLVITMSSMGHLATAEQHNTATAFVNLLQHEQQPFHLKF